MDKKACVFFVAILTLISVAGVWEGELWTPYGVASLTLRLEQDGEKVWGTYDFKGTRGGRDNIVVEGTLKGNALSLAIPSIAFGGIEAIVDGDQMEGTYRGGSGYLNQLKATRKPKAQ